VDRHRNGCRWDKEIRIGWDGIDAAVFSVAIIAIGSGDVEAAVRVFVCRPLASKFVVRVEPGTKGLAKTAIGVGPQ
jgi:hypothetical protein